MAAHRANNFTEDETMIIVQEATKRKQTIIGKFSPTLTKATKSTGGHARVDARGGYVLQEALP